MGFEKGGQPFPSDVADEHILRRYDEIRNTPSIETSRESLALRFGTVSIRSLVRKALALNETYLNELVWREFFMQLLYHRPETATQNADSRYDQIAWRNNEVEFIKWCNGQTGYPLVDAGMRQLNAIGWMHNRVRMVTASFLVKHLLIDWRWGEAYFAEKLQDYEMASNVGNWKWVAGSGADSAPYFRIFNPIEQQKRFDPHFHYVRQWVPEIMTTQYPQPMVEHTFARKRALETYKIALSSF
jgi:deoxyribodipyrimidine photo-lyase